jgi:hypothetical protein
MEQGGWLDVRSVNRTRLPLASRRMDRVAAEQPQQKEKRMMDWFRSWHGALVDPKWLLIGKKANVPPAIVTAIFWALLDHASQADDRGDIGSFDTESYAEFGGINESDVKNVIEELRKKGIISGTSIKSWKKRQPSREDPTASMRQANRRKRVREGASSHVESRDVTPEQIRIDDTRQEQTKGSGAAFAAAPIMNSMPPKTIELDSHGGTKHVFEGRTIRITQSQLDEWKGRYPAIEDFDAELRLADDYYTETPPQDGKWFFPVSKWLDRSNKRAANEKKEAERGDTWF